MFKATAVPLHIVVTGAGGFVGGYLADSLAERGHVVTATTRGPLPAVSRPGLAWAQLDLTARSSLPSQFDVLVHCAAEIPARCPEPDLLYARNMDVSCNVFHQAIEAGARTVIFLSSMSVYGRISVPVVTEDVAPDHPDAYGRANWDSERLLMELAQGGLLSALSIRLPGTVGRGSHHNFLSDVMRNVLDGEAVQAHNPDALFNNIVYVGALSDFIWQRAEQPISGYNVTNLAAEDPLTVAAVMSLLFQSAGRAEMLHFTTGGKQPFLISLDRALALGFAPLTVKASVEAMVRDCISTDAMSG